MNENYNIEDTAKLMTKASGGGKKKTILIAAVTAAVLIVALVAGYFVISDKKYEDQVAIAEKCFIEGDYAQAEAEYIKAMDMNKRKLKAKEGLAYTYAVEGKFQESADLYDEIYQETKEEKRSPFISKIPLLGRLFKSSAKITEKSQMVIYLVPHLEGYEPAVMDYDRAWVRKKLNEIESCLCKAEIKEVL